MTSAFSSITPRRSLASGTWLSGNVHADFDVLFGVPLGGQLDSDFETDRSRCTWKEVRPSTSATRQHHLTNLNLSRPELDGGSEPLRRNSMFHSLRSQELPGRRSSTTVPSSPSAPLSRSPRQCNSHTRWAYSCGYTRGQRSEFVSEFSGGRGLDLRYRELARRRP